MQKLARDSLPSGFNTPSKSDILSNTDLVASRHILISFFPLKKGKKPHFRLTCVVEKRPLRKIYYGSWSSSARQIPFLLFATTATRIHETSSLRSILSSVFETISMTLQKSWLMNQANELWKSAEEQSVEPIFSLELRHEDPPQAQVTQANCLWHVRVS